MAERHIHMNAALRLVKLWISGRSKRHQRTAFCEIMRYYRVSENTVRGLESNYNPKTLISRPCPEPLKVPRRPLGFPPRSQATLGNARRMAPAMPTRTP
jgi:hypothetical protein